MFWGFVFRGEPSKAGNFLSAHLVAACDAKLVYASLCCFLSLWTFSRRSETINLRVPRQKRHLFINHIDWSTRSDRQRWWWYRTELAVGPFERTWSQVFRTVLVEVSRFCPENCYINKTAYRKNVFVCFRTENASAHANRLFTTKLPLMIGAAFMEKRS